MTQQQRMILAIALCGVIYLVFNWLAPPPPPVEGEGEAIADVGTDPSTKPNVPVSTTAPRSSVPPAPVPDSQIAAVSHRVESDLLALELSNVAPQRAGIIAKMELLADKFGGHETAGNALGLGANSTMAVSLVDAASDVRIPVEANYALKEKGPRHAVFAYGDGSVEVRERYELLAGYEARLTVEVVNRSAAAQRHRLTLVTRVSPGESQYDPHLGLCRTVEGIEDEDASDVEDGPVKHVGPVVWGGVDTKYFLHAVVGEERFEECQVALGGTASDILETTLRTPVAMVEAGGTKTWTFGVYLGAKELERLQAFSALPEVDAHLTDAIEWGFLGGFGEWLGRLLLAILRWLHEVVQSWGVAIVLLTVVVKLVTLPLTLKQMQSMKRMKEIQPEVEKIKKKYGEDRVKQGQELQALFARSGVNPLAGCLPMLVQLPIWFALYAMLSAAVELVHEPFLWLPDLTKQDPYYIMPLALGAMMVLQNRMMPNTMDEAQAKMMRWLMPVMFTAFMLFLPSGLAVYIFANVVLSIVQTAVQLRTKQPATT